MWEKLRNFWEGRSGKLCAGRQGPKKVKNELRIDERILTAFIAMIRQRAEIRTEGARLSLGLVRIVGA